MGLVSQKKKKEKKETLEAQLQAYVPTHLVQRHSVKKTHPWISPQHQ